MLPVLLMLLMLSDTSSSTFLRSGMSLVGPKVEEIEGGGGRRWRR